MDKLFALLVIAMPIYLLYNHIFYYKERIINSDEGFPLYNFVEHNVVDMVNFRILQVIYSIPPILFNVLGFDVKIIAIVYAISFSAPVFITMYILYKHSFKYYLIFILSYTFFISYQYYFPIAEYWLGTCLYFILYMLLDKYNTTISNKIVAGIILILILNLHLSLFYQSVVLLVYM